MGVLAKDLADNHYTIECKIFLKDLHFDTRCDIIYREGV